MAFCFWARWDNRDQIYPPAWNNQENQAKYTKQQFLRRQQILANKGQQSWRERKQVRWALFVPSYAWKDPVLLPGVRRQSWESRETKTLSLKGRVLEERAAERESLRDLQRMGIQQGTDLTYVKKLPKARERAIRNGSTVIPHYLWGIGSRPPTDTKSHSCSSPLQLAIHIHRCRTQLCIFISLA